MDGRVGPPSRPQHGVGIGDIAGDDLDAERLQRRGVRGLAGQCAHVVAPLGQLLADVGAGQSGGAGHEDRLAHADSCSSDSSGLAASTWSGL